MVFFFNDTATTEIYTLSLHDALPIYNRWPAASASRGISANRSTGRLSRSMFSVGRSTQRSEEHTSELQSRQYLVCRLLLEKKKNTESTDRGDGLETADTRGELCSNLN